jgi:type 1 fimbria pilin
MQRLLPLVLLPAVAMAAPGKLPRPVDGEVATILVNTQVVESPCWLKFKTADQSVQLPPVSTKQLSEPGMRSAETVFSIQIRGCIAEPGRGTDTRTGLHTWSPDSPVMSAWFEGVQDPDTPALFAVKGITGAGLRLMDEMGRQVLRGEKTTPTIVTTINNTLYWRVALERTSAKLNAGRYWAVLNFSVIYD